MPVNLFANVHVLSINGAIGPATSQYILEGLQTANQQNSDAIILEINTPGGLVSSMLAITQGILNSKTPVISYVSPKGASATSAGAFIVYASPVAVMAPATNIGAASPIPLGGDAPNNNPKPEQDEQDPSPQTTGQVKAMEDLSARMRAMAERHHRNPEAAQAMVLQGKSFSAETAVKDNIVNFMADDLNDLLVKLDGYVIKIGPQTQTIYTANKSVIRISPDWRDQLLSIITNPNVTYLLILLGMYGIILEFYNPGSFYPGIIGAISIVLAGYGLHLLPVNYAGGALLVLGIALLVVEATTPSYGIFGTGGAIAFILGSLFLIDTTAPDFMISKWLIGTMMVITLGIIYVLLRMIIGSRRAQDNTGSEGMMGVTVIATTSFNHQGQVKYQGVFYNAITHKPITKGQLAKVTKIDGITLTITPSKTNQGD